MQTIIANNAKTIINKIPLVALCVSITGTYISYDNRKNTREIRNMMLDHTMNTQTLIEKVSKK